MQHDSPTKKKMTTDQSHSVNPKLYILPPVIIHWCFPARLGFPSRTNRSGSRSQRVLDPSLPPWSPPTQMERPNCSGCLTIKAPMVELNYTNSKQFFLSRLDTKRGGRHVCPSSWEALWFTIKIKPALFVIIRGNVGQLWSGRVQWKDREPLMHWLEAYQHRVVEEGKTWWRTRGSVCGGEKSTPVRVFRWKVDVNAAATDDVMALLSRVGKWQTTNIMSLNLGWFFRYLEVFLCFLCSQYLYTNICFTTFFGGGGGNPDYFVFKV